MAIRFGQDWGASRNSFRDAPNTTPKPSSIRSDDSVSSGSEGLLGSRSQTNLSPASSVTRSNTDTIADLDTARNYGSKVSKGITIGGLFSQNKGLLGLGAAIGTGVSVLGIAGNVAKGNYGEALVSGLSYVTPYAGYALAAYSVGKSIYGSWADGMLGDALDSRDNEGFRDSLESAYGYGYDDTKTFSSDFNSLANVGATNDFNDRTLAQTDLVSQWGGYDPVTGFSETIGIDARNLSAWATVDRWNPNPNPNPTLTPTKDYATGNSWASPNDTKAGFSVAPGTWSDVDFDNQRGITSGDSMSSIGFDSGGGQPSGGGSDAGSSSDSGAGGSV